MGKKTYIMYKGWNDMLKALPDADLGKVMKAVLGFQDGEEIKVDNPILNAIVLLIVSQMQTDNAEYEKTCEKRREAGAAGGQAKATKSKQMVASDKQTVANVADNDNDNDNDKKIKKKNIKKEKFGEYQNVALTAEENQKLASEYGIDLRDKAVSFLDAYIEDKHYKSASHYLAIRRWVINAVQESKPVKKNQNFDGRKYDFMALEKEVSNG